MRKRLLYQEADFYGASRLIFKESQRPLCYKASWMHGLGPVFFRNDSKSEVILHYYEAKLPLHLVNNLDTQERLQLEGINARAVGMPIIYTNAYDQDDTVKRYQRLFMPSHTLAKKDRSAEFQEWRQLMDKYGCDAICLAASDYEFVTENKVDLGNVTILKGAHAGDDTSLERIANHFRCSHELISNSSGSHVVYATALGVNVPIIPEFLERAKILRARSDSQVHMTSSVPKAKLNAFKQHMKKCVVENVADLWGSNDTLAKIEYSNYLLGVDCKESHLVVQKLLQPDSTVQAFRILQTLFRNKLMHRLGCL